ncbi:uncharacterized protein LOC117227836 isoform X2 [Megalopta genalis]|uniref:uncharacterized protein LOC117227836 isoform X2 n=1 Tax=Megalopta genalis TaxID=115081 RepID=UPI0014434698|nr:putative carbonic anhydrase 2 isoform X2 [Megalopta genalis]
MRFPGILMDSKVPFWIPLIASIVAMTSAAAIARRPADDEIARTIRAYDGGPDNGDREVNAELRVASGVHGDRYRRQSYKDGSIGSVHNSLDKQSEDDSDGYNHDFKHDYHHSHGYRSYHHHSDGDKDGDDGYHSYHRVHFGHGDGDKGDGKGDGNRGHDGDDYKNSGYHYDSEFEIHFGDSGKESDGQKYSEDDGDHNGYGKGYEHARKQSLNDDRNKGVDDRGTGYHYGHSGTGGNYGKDYPSLPIIYRQHGRDHDRWSHRYGVVHGDR